MKDRHRSIRIFENPILERLTHVHPIVPLLIWGPVIGFLIVHSFKILSIGKVAVLGLSGMLGWTLFEYFLHRFIFHMPTNNSFSKRLQFIIHGLHHEDPQDPTRLVMPPAAGIIIALILFTLFRSVLGKTYVEPFLGFFLFGYLCYDYIHYFVHHSVPKNFIGRKIRSYHLKHHYANPDSRWGVSNPLWDFVFVTMNAKTVAGKISVDKVSIAMSQPLAELTPEVATFMVSESSGEEPFLNSNAIR